MRNNLLAAALAGCLALFAAARPARAQDLFQRYEAAGKKSQDKAKPRVETDRSRLDLRLAPDFLPFVPAATSGSSKLGVSADFDYNFACGNFDIRAQFQHLLSREVLEENLQTVMGMIEAQLAKSSMVLLCETSPTLCQALQHFRISANGLLKLNYDRCAAIEQALDTSEKSLYTNALKQCMDERAKEGKSIDQALEECRKMTKVRSLRGSQVAELDLTKDVADMLGLSKEVRDTLGILGGETKYGPHGLDAKIDSKAVERRYLTHRDAYTQAWQKAVQKLQSRQEVADEDLAALSPDGSRPVAREELANVALLGEQERAILVASMASLAAKLKLDGEIREAERAYQVVAMSPTVDQKYVKALEQRVDWLRKERSRLEEAYQSQRELNDALLAIRTVGHQEMMKRAQTHYDAAKQRGVEKRIVADTRPFGSRSVPSDAKQKAASDTTVGSDCTSGCGGSDFKWGE